MWKEKVIDWAIYSFASVVIGLAMAIALVAVAAFVTLSLPDAHVVGILCRIFTSVMFVGVNIAYFLGEFDDQ